MKQIDNYSYSIDSNGTLTIFTRKNNQDFIIATLEECLSPKATHKGICSLIEDILPDLDYELI